MKNRLRHYAALLWREWIRPLALAAAIVFPMKSALAEWSYVPTGSMEPSIVPVELVWVNKLAYDLKVPFTTHHLAEWGSPQRGEIVVFFSPADDKRLVKRVIGMPGDVVEMHDDRLTINGVPLNYGPLASSATTPVGPAPDAFLATEYLAGRPHPVMIQPHLPALRNFGPVQVPPGEYFVMGDNRDNSSDSRFIGTIARDRIVGRATTIVASIDPDRFALPRFNRFFQALP
jgi:signal peptidase I